MNSRGVLTVVTLVESCIRSPREVFDDLGRLLAEYRTVADDASYYFVASQLEALWLEVCDPLHTLEDFEAVYAKARRYADALATAVKEWREGFNWCGC